jgi:hypothetical protein
MNFFKLASGIAPRNWSTSAPFRKAITVGRADTWIDRGEGGAGIVVSQVVSNQIISGTGWQAGREILNEVLLCGGAPNVHPSVRPFIHQLSTLNAID